MQVPPLDDIRCRKRALENAITRGRSVRWQLRLWSRLVKTRDGHRCVNCEATTEIEAHHIIRKILSPASALDVGNGITLCRSCHRCIHAESNKKPDLAKPMGAAQGDDQDEWAFLFGCLLEDANARGLAEEEFYHLGDEILVFSVSYQGYEDLLELVYTGAMSRVRFMHEIWRGARQKFYTNLAEDIGVFLVGRYA